MLYLFNFSLFGGEAFFHDYLDGLDLVYEVVSGFWVGSGVGLMGSWICISDVLDVLLVIFGEVSGVLGVGLVVC
jgi:hypothetical protein